MRSSRNNIVCTAKPFVKWAGGKSQLLDEIDWQLPQIVKEGGNFNYVEPFVGGGAVLFYLLTKYQNIQHALINDINVRLITVYREIKSRPEQLIIELRKLQNDYLPLSHDKRTDMFLSARKTFNDGKTNTLETAALFIFLNRTCFNGLYRENSKGEFNVPHGRYTNPCICDETTIMADSELLQRVQIQHGDFASTLPFANKMTLFYFDPPYKPLNNTSSFNTYVKEPFNDAEQIRLKEFVHQVVANGAQFILSNSDVKGKNPTNNFFDELYRDFIIRRVFATRMVNANPQKRGKLTELMITNIQTLHTVEDAI